MLPPLGKIDCLTTEINLPLMANLGRVPHNTMEGNSNVVLFSTNSPGSTGTQKIYCTLEAYFVFML